MKNLYLAAAIVGGVVPYFFFLQWFGTHGIDLPGFIAAWFVNGSGSGIAADILISSCVFWAFMLHRNRYSHGPGPWLFIALNLLIGLSCALPAYLYAQERQRETSTAS